MSKIADYLRERLTGEVSTDINVRHSFATDGSIFTHTPQIIIYPRTTNDVRKVMRFVWRLAERGQALPITARGSGTDTTGGAIGSGAIVSFPAHMSRILETDVKSQMVRVQPGLSLATLQESMATHGLFLPVMPSDFKAATVGGALGCDATGTKSVKYGGMHDWVDRLEIVLANGEIIQTGRITARELNAKKGLQTMEGEIYRSLDSLIEDNIDTIVDMGSSEGTPGASGLYQVKARDGSFDLTPLLVGSQGTLGITVQTIVKLSPRPEEVSLLAAAITSDQDIESLREQLLELQPSELEFIDGDTLKLIEKCDGGKPWKVVTDKLPDKLIFVEFDDKHHARSIKKAAKILDAAGVTDAKIATEWEDQETLRSVHHSVASITNFEHRGIAALPLATNISVQPEKVTELVTEIKKLLKRNHVAGGVWGSLGAGTVSVRPLINLANLGQRQTVFKFLNELQVVVSGLGGAISGGSALGRLYAPYLEKQNSKVSDLQLKVKEIFDPYNLLNPGVGTGVTQTQLVEQLRREYDQSRFSEFSLRG